VNWKKSSNRGGSVRQSIFKAIYDNENLLKIHCNTSYSEHPKSRHSNTG
jgi:hypothetical protein